MTDGRSVTLILSDSVTAKVRVRSSDQLITTFSAFRKIRGNYCCVSLPVAAWAQLGTSSSRYAVHQLSFSGWRIAEGIPHFHRRAIDEHLCTSGGIVTEIFLIIGVNDMRFVVFLFCYTFFFFMTFFYFQRVEWLQRR